MGYSVDPGMLDTFGMSVPLNVCPLSLEVTHVQTSDLQEPLEQQDPDAATPGWQGVSVMWPINLETAGQPYLIDRMQQKSRGNCVKKEIWGGEGKGKMGREEGWDEWTRRWAER